MYKDALGNIIFEFWEGIKVNGRTFQNEPLYYLCRTYGDAQVTDACQQLEIFPVEENLSRIAKECEQMEQRFV